MKQADRVKVHANKTYAALRDMNIKNMGDSGRRQQHINLLNALESYLFEEEGLTSNEIAHIRNGKYIEAIKALRSRCIGLSLTEAKGTVDRYRSKHGLLGSQ